MFTKSLEEGCRDRSMAYTNFGNSLYQLQRYEEAAAAWSKALQINPLNQNAKKGMTLLKHEEQGAL
jgi:tetratricopeptide (TPR) repeat protein